MKIILFNGPPSSGKDTAMTAVVDFLGKQDYNATPFFIPYTDRMSYPIKVALAAILEDELTGDGNLASYNTPEAKEAVIPSLGVSARQWQIDFSEKFMKPLYGNDVFARLFCARVRSYEDTSLENEYVYLVPDCGFQIELNTVLDHFDSADILLIQLHREGCDFSKDSREYVNAAVTKESGLYRCNFTPIMNIELEVFKRTVVQVVSRFLEESSDANKK